MTPEEFARGVAEEKNRIVEAYALKLPAEQHALLRQIIDGALTDMCYTILLGLDGAASFGSLEQQEFGLFDEKGNQLTGGELEAAAYEVFHGEEE